VVDRIEYDSFTCDKIGQTVRRQSKLSGRMRAGANASKYENLAEISQKLCDKVNMGRIMSETERRAAASQRSKSERKRLRFVTFY
jgi:hypothetical protein